MTSLTKHSNLELRQEIVKLVVDENYSIRGAAETMRIGKSTVDK